MTDLDHVTVEIEKETAVSRAQHNERMRCIGILREQARELRKDHPRQAIEVLRGALRILREPRQ